jgi:hypothetical protein
MIGDGWDWIITGGNEASKTGASREIGLQEWVQMRVGKLEDGGP